MGVDLKRPEFDKSRAQVFLNYDLRNKFFDIFNGVPWDRVYHLAADMGGIGFIESHRHEIVSNNTQIDLNILDWALRQQERQHTEGKLRLLYLSTACIYPDYRQKDVVAVPLKESDAYPAMPEDGYGWQKLYAERMCQHAWKDRGLETRVVRLHNIYGPLGTYVGGREKSPAAICRKIAMARDGEEIEVWGDGKQTRTYCYVDDCVEGLIALMESEHRDPINIGTDRLVSIDGLIDIIAGIAGKKIGKRYELDRPKGVRGRSADTTLARNILGWEPKVSLEEGLARTYAWIAEQLI